jgi:hypothetical protein
MAFRRIPEIDLTTELNHLIEKFVEIIARPFGNALKML